MSYWRVLLVFLGPKTALFLQEKGLNFAGGLTKKRAMLGDAWNWPNFSKILKTQLLFIEIVINQEKCLAWLFSCSNRTEVKKADIPDCYDSKSKPDPFKPWPNGVASRHKLKTWVYLWLRLARACVHLRWLAMTCAHFGRNQICTQVRARFSPFGHPSQVKARWVTSISLSLANEIQDMSALKWVFCDSRVLVRKLASPFGHPTQVSTQVQLASTCDYLPVRLTRALEMLLP